MERALAPLKADIHCVYRETPHSLIPFIREVFHELPGLDYKNPHHRPHLPLEKGAAAPEERDGEVFCPNRTLFLLCLEAQLSPVTICLYINFTRVNRWEPVEFPEIVL
jgi:hypothetical protein